VRDDSKSSQQYASSTVTQQPGQVRSSSTLDSLRQGSDEPPSPPNHPRRRTWLWLAALAVLLLAGVIVWREFTRHSQAASTKPKTPPATPVVAAEARQGDIPVYFTGLGAVTSIYTVTIKTRVDGQINKVSYIEGQAVKKGQPLVDIDSRPYEVQLIQAQGQLMKDQAALENARIDLQRYQALLAKNAVAQQIYATQKATVAQDEGNVKTDEGNIASAKLNIAYCHINASITGRVGLRLVDPGNLVSAASATPLVVITQTMPISVIFTLPEEQIPEVLKRERAGAHLAVAALDRESKNVIANGELTTIDNQIDQTTGTLRFRATFPNKDESLFANQFVNARLLVETKQNVTLLPNAAIQRNGSATFVYLLQPDKSVTVRNVKVGTTDANESEVSSGVSPGDVVITQGVDKLQEGSRVQAQIQSADTPAKNNQPGTSASSSASSNSDAKSGKHRTSPATGPSQKP